MIKIGFIGSVSKEWMGGYNYFKNLLYAINVLGSNELKVFVFLGKKSSPLTKGMFKKYATVIEDSAFDRMSLKWFLIKIEERIFKTNYILEFILNKYGIQVLSHSFITKFKIIKTVNWIPDFQHIHLPEMFSKKELKNRDKTFLNVIKQSDIIIVSSNDALTDLKNFAPGYEVKVKVLQFVSQPVQKYNAMTKNILKIKYGIKNDYFYIPNQFWKHKNHLSVFKAINQLRNENINIHLICSGYLEDYRNKNHIEVLKNYIFQTNLNNNIKLLGLIDYEDVFNLIKFSEAVINPSLFEGWSTTVEECKSVGKNMILSDLNVHKEQYPTALFFDRNKEDSLIEVLRNYKGHNIGNKRELLRDRTKEFAEKYIRIVKKAI
jgi:glycosyltransferase involved in cell wall biosynthesis